MNRPRITKQTLKELRGKLLSEQKMQKQEMIVGLKEITQSNGADFRDEFAEQNDPVLEEELEM